MWAARLPGLAEAWPGSALAWSCGTVPWRELSLAAGPVCSVTALELWGFTGMNVCFAGSSVHGQCQLGCTKRSQPRRCAMPRLLWHWGRTGARASALAVTLRAASPPACASGTACWSPVSFPRDCFAGSLKQFRYHLH